MLEVFSLCLWTFHADIWSVIIAILKKNLNLNACTEIGLTEGVLRIFEDTSDIVVDFQSEMQGVSANYSIPFKVL